MAIRMMKVDILKLAAGIIPGTKEGDHILSFPGGVQFVVPQSVIDNLDPESDNEPVLVVTQGPTSAKPLPPAPVVRDVRAYEDPEEPNKEDLSTRICIECGTRTKRIMPSGKCYNCSRVKCPTCESEATRAEMIGTYCPKCLPRIPRSG